jgi:ABC-type Na+ efflux pump permease subunit
MVITGKVIALFIFALISIAILFVVGKKILKALKDANILPQ